MAVSRRVSVAMTASAMLVSAGLGYAVFGPGSGSAQTSTTGGSGGSGATAQPPKSFQGNEDPTHEKGESAQREADEKAGRAHFGGHDGGHDDGHFTPNTDPAHEKTESAEREAQERADATPSAP